MPFPPMEHVGLGWVSFEIKNIYIKYIWYITYYLEMIECEYLPNIKTEKQKNRVKVNNRGDVD